MPIKNTQKQPCEQQNRSFTYLVVSLFSVIISHRPKCSIIKSEPGFSFSFFLFLSKVLVIYVVLVVSPDLSLTI